MLRSSLPSTNMSYAFFDMGERYSFATLVPTDTSYFVEVFSKRTIDSSGLLVEHFLSGTAYSISRSELVKDLKHDLRRARSQKPLIVPMDWEYSFIVKGKTVASLHDNKRPYLYQRLRFNPPLF